MIIKRPKQAVLTPCGLPAKMVFRAYRPPSDLLSVAKIVRLLFSNSEQGAVYDPSDMSTLFQDSAGTTPVTAVEQPVGLILDKSGRGNHATQATTTKRPVLSRRVNLLTKTENMVPTSVAGTAWTRGAFGNWIAPTNLGPTLAPDGSNNAVGVKTNGTGGISSLVHRSSVLPSTTYKFTVQVRKVEGEDQAGLSQLRLVFQTGNNGVLVSSVAAFVEIGTSVSDSWQQFEISYTTPATGVNQAEVGLLFVSGLSAAVAVWGGSLTLAADANLPYQRVNTATDYDADPARFPAFRRLDGVDDSLACATGGGGSAGFFFSSVVSPGDSAGTNRTLFSDAGTNTGYIVRLNTSNQLELAAGNGTSYTTIAVAGTLAVGTSDVVQAWDDGVNLNVKIGTGPTASIARPAVVAGTAGYTLGQDNGSSSGYFNGRIYGEIYRKDSGLTQSQREAVAVFQRQKARIA